MVCRPAGCAILRREIGKIGIVGLEDGPVFDGVGGDYSIGNEGAEFIKGCLIVPLIRNAIETPRGKFLWEGR